MRALLLTTVSTLALLCATPADALQSRQQCYGFTLFGQQFDCGHDHATERGAAPRRAEPPAGDDDDGDDDDDDDGDDDDDDDDDGGCKDPKGNKRS